MVKMFPSLNSVNILEIKASIETLEPYCDGFHIDVMDGHFVPNLTFGPAVINALAKAVSKQLFVHLMVENPEKLLEYLQLPEDSLVVFHKNSFICYFPYYKRKYNSANIFLIRYLGDL